MDGLGLLQFGSPLLVLLPRGVALGERLLLLAAQGGDRCFGAGACGLKFLVKAVDLGLERTAGLAVQGRRRQSARGRRGQFLRDAFFFRLGLSQIRLVLGKRRVQALQSRFLFRQRRSVIRLMLGKRRVQLLQSRFFFRQRGGMIRLMLGESRVERLQTRLLLGEGRRVLLLQFRQSFVVLGEGLRMFVAQVG